MHSPRRSSDKGSSGFSCKCYSRKDNNDSSWRYIELAYLKLFLPIFFLLGLSFVSVFGDIGSITVVSGKTFQINYDANYVQVLGAQVNTQDQGLIFSIRVTNPT